MERAAIGGLEDGGGVGVVEGPIGGVWEVPPEHLSELEARFEACGLHQRGDLGVGVLDVIPEGRRNSLVRRVLAAEAGNGLNRSAVRIMLASDDSGMIIGRQHQFLTEGRQALHAVSQEFSKGVGLPVPCSTAEYRSDGVTDDPHAHHAIGERSGYAEG